MNHNDAVLNQSNVLLEAAADPWDRSFLEPLPAIGTPDECRVQILDWFEQGLLAGIAAGKKLTDELLTTSFASLQDWFSSNDDSFTAAFIRLLLRLAPEDPQAISSVMGKQLELLGSSDTSAFFGDACGGESPTEDRVLKVTSALRQNTVGSYRMLFPTYQGTENNEIGGLVAVKVTAVRSLENWPSESSVVIAPWTFFLPIDDEHGSLSRLQQDLLLSISDALNRKTSDGLTGLRLIIELQPLRPNDVQSDGTGGDQATSQSARQAAVWGLTPPAFDIEGPSLGLATALAAWAASQQLSVRPTIATGAITTNEQISGVGGKRAKLEAIAHFQTIACRQWNVLLAKDDLETPEVQNVLREMSRKWKPHGVGSLAKLLADRAGLLTDGFDEWRRVAGVVGDDVGECFALASELAKAPDEVVEGYSKKDRDQANALVEELLVRFSSAVSQSKELDGQDSIWYVTVPFGADPRVMCNWLAKELRETWWRSNKDDSKRNQEHLVDLPVVLPVSLCDMRIDGTSATTLADLLAQALNARYAGAHATPDAMAIALRRPGKLVLLVYDLPSVELAGINDDQLAAGEILWQQLQELRTVKPAKGATSDDEGYQQQYVIAICSDEHHKRMWQKAGQGVVVSV